jgi:hypothetical protein
MSLEQAVRRVRRARRLMSVVEATRTSLGDDEIVVLFHLLCRFID